MIDFVLGLPRTSGDCCVGEYEVEDYVVGCETWLGSYKVETKEGGYVGGHDVLSWTLKILLESAKVVREGVRTFWKKQGLPASQAPK